jgi:hypothetical protein
MAQRRLIAVLFFSLVFYKNAGRTVEKALQGRTRPPFRSRQAMVYCIQNQPREKEKEKSMFRDKAGNLSVGRVVGAVVILLLGSSFSEAALLSSRPVNPALFSRLVRRAKSLWSGYPSQDTFCSEIITINNRICENRSHYRSVQQRHANVSTVNAVNYSHQQKLQRCYLQQKLGLATKMFLITPAINEVLKAVTAQYTAQQLVGTRGDVSIQLDEA